MEVHQYDADLIYHDFVEDELEKIKFLQIHRACMQHFLSVKMQKWKLHANMFCSEYSEVSPQIESLM